MSTPRRRFLGWLGGASLLGVAGAPSSVRAQLLGASPIEGASNPHPEPITETWDMSWTSRVTGKYKAVFDSPEPADGAALFRAVAWCDQYKEVYGAARSEMSPVVVMRHTAIALVMDDEYWSRFDIGKELKMRDEKGKKWTKVNPVSVRSKTGDAESKKYAIETFMADGGIVLACSWAFGFASSHYRKADNLDAAGARAKAKEHLIPGVILQPNGIFAALRAQEAGCSYIMAS